MIPLYNGTITFRNCQALILMQLKSRACASTPGHNDIQPEADMLPLP